MFQCDANDQSAGERLVRLAELMADLSRQSVELLVCPELFSSGYNNPQGISENSEPAGGEFASRVAQLSKRYNMAVTFGYPEEDRGHIYNSAIVFDGLGAQLANHRKLSLPNRFENEQFALGNDVTIFELSGFRVALLICSDVEIVENVRQAADAGATLIVVPAALRERWPIVVEKLIPTRAYESGVFVVYANHAGVENGLSYLGCSCIVGPDGEYVARAPAREAVIVGDVCSEKVIEARRVLPYLSDGLGASFTRPS